MAQAFENILYYKIKLVIKMLYLVCLTVSTIKFCKISITIFQKYFKIFINFLELFQLTLRKTDCLKIQLFHYEFQKNWPKLL